MSESKTVPLSNLVADDAVNARRSDRDKGLGELKASILAHGVVQSLRVRPRGKKLAVIAGNRRLAAMLDLLKEKKIEASFPVPVIVADASDADAHELSIVENVERVPVSAVDEFRAFGRLHDEGKSVDDIADRFGVPKRRVQQRMKLAALHPKIIDMLEAGEIQMDAAQSFTIQPDQERQFAYVESVGSEKWKLSAHYVQNAMAATSLQATSALAKLIGETAYIAAGGAIIADLFGDRTYWSSGDVIDRLAAEHWERASAAWLAAGWAWVAPSADYPNIHSEQKLLASPLPMSDEQVALVGALEQDLAALMGDVVNSWQLPDDDARKAREIEDKIRKAKWTERVFSTEQQSQSGVVYAVDGSNVWYGVIDSSKAAGPAAPLAAPKAPEDLKTVAAPVSLALSVAMTDALQAHVATRPDIALQILVATLYSRMRFYGYPPVHITGAHSDKKVDDKFAIGTNFADVLMWAGSQSRETLLELLAELVSENLDVRDGSEGLASDKAALVAFVDPSVETAFDAVAYFAGVRKSQVVLAFLEMTGETLKDGKKGDMADVAAKMAVETGWLPLQLRTPSYAGPGSAEVLRAAE